MKVIEYTANRLVLYDRSVLKYWTIGCLYILGTTAFFGIFALPFILVLPSFVWNYLTEELMATVTCTRTQSSQNMCQLVRSQRIGKQVIDIPVNDLQSANVINIKGFVTNNRRRKKAYSSYYVSLNKKWGSLRFSLHESYNEDEQKSHASKINHFIHNPDEHYLNIQQKAQQQRLTFMSIFPPVIISIFGLMFIAVPLTIMSLTTLYFLRVTTCTFDKVTGMMTLKHEALRKTFDSIVIQCPIEEITDIQIKAFYGRGDSWKIELILEQSQPISLNWMETPDKEEKLAAADCIRRFLNLQNSQF